MRALRDLSWAMKRTVPDVRSLVIGTCQVTRAFFMVLSKSYDA